MNKTLDTTSIANELKGASAFFSPVKKPVRKGSRPAPGRDVRSKAEGKKKAAPPSVPPRDSDATDPTRERFSAQEQRHPVELARYQASMIEEIRKVVRLVGKEVAFVRATPAEKQQLGDVVYAYKRQGIKTSENELLRIGLVFLLEDYAANGKESVLARAIEALNA